MKNELKKIVLLMLVLWPCVAMGASSSKHKTFTHKYKDARLTVVLEDIARRTDYQLRYDEADMDAERRVTASFKDVSARSAYKRLIGKEYDIMVKKSVITITRKPLPPTVYTHVAVAPTRVEDDSLMTIRVYEDTTFSVSCKKVTQVTETREEWDAKQKKKKAVETPKGKCFLQVSTGLGYGSLGARMTDVSALSMTSAPSEAQSAKTVGNFGGNLQVAMAYYFHDNWGALAGVGFSGYGSTSTLNIEKQWAGQKDSDGEPYNHIARTTDWRERQILNMIDIPLAIQCRYPIKKSKVSVFADAGLLIGIPLHPTYQLREGTLRHSGYYPQWKMLMMEGLEDRDFYSETVEHDFSGARERMSIAPVSVGVMADAGVLVPLTPQLDLMLGAFFRMSCNDMRRAGDEMGWQQSDYSGPMAYRNHTFMNQYAGTIGSEYTQSVRPFQVGVRVGISWTPKKKPVQGPPFYELVERCDTTYTLALRCDTTLKPQTTAAKQIVRIMEKSVIWFALDSYVPILEPADMLDRIAEVLIANPGQRIQVNGHASREGNALRNQRLSENRAKAVARLLMEKGVPQSQIQVQAFGTTIEYQVEEGREHTISLDRRVEIIPIND